MIREQQCETDLLYFRQAGRLICSTCILTVTWATDPWNLPPSLVRSLSTVLYKTLLNLKERHHCSLWEKPPVSHYCPLGIAPCLTARPSCCSLSWGSVCLLCIYHVFGQIKSCHFPLWEWRTVWSGKESQECKAHFMFMSKQSTRRICWSVFCGVSRFHLFMSLISG